MKKYFSHALVLIFVLFLLLPVAEARPDKRMREKIRDKIHVLKMWKMIEYLDLDEETGFRLFSVVKKYDKENMKLMRESRKSVHDLKSELDKQSSDTTTIQSLMTRIRENADRVHQLKQERIDAAGKILSIEQQAKYVVFEIEFMKEMAKMTQNAMRRGHRPSGEREKRQRP